MDKLIAGAVAVEVEESAIGAVLLKQFGDHSLCAIGDALGVVFVAQVGYDDDLIGHSDDFVDRFQGMLVV